MICLFEVLNCDLAAANCTLPYVGGLQFVSGTKQASPGWIGRLGHIDRVATCLMSWAFLLDNSPIFFSLQIVQVF